MRTLANVYQQTLHAAQLGAERAIDGRPSPVSWAEPFKPLIVRRAHHRRVTASHHVLPSGRECPLR